MLVTVVIPAYNAAATLGRCLEACLEQTHDQTEIVVVDDGSTDSTSRIAAQHGVDYIYQERQGPAAARNKGVQRARGTIVAFTDADCIPATDWIAQLLVAFEEHVAGVGGAYDIANPNRFLACMIQFEIAARHAGLDTYVDFLGSFNVAYRKEVFEAVGGFDETYRAASAEDNDLAYRIQDAGYRLKFTHRARVAHYHPARLPAYLRTQMRHGAWRVKLYVDHPARARRGDNYAGRADLWAPALALIAATGALSVPAAFALTDYGLAAAGAVLTAATLCVILHVPLAGRILRLSGEPAMCLYPVMALLRDIARGAGMIAGLVRFGLLSVRKRT